MDKALGCRMMVVLVMSLSIARIAVFGEKEFVQVIGVARDSKYNSLGEDPTPFIYVPLIQNPSTGVTLFFRSNGDTRSVIPSVRGQVQALDRNLPLTNV